MSRGRPPESGRRLAVLLALAVFLLVLLVVVTTARGEDSPPPPTLKGKTIEEWAALADRRLGKLGHTERRVLQAHRDLRAIRSSLRAQVRMDGTTGEVRALLCIHRFEGAWNDPGSPYFGGLQMDVDFQRSYGGTYYRELGTANVWPPFLQLAVGLKAVLDGRGFGPWPETRKRCGV